MLCKIDLQRCLINDGGVREGVESVVEHSFLVEMLLVGRNLGLGAAVRVSESCLHPWLLGQRWGLSKEAARLLYFSPLGSDM